MRTIGIRASSDDVVFAIYDDALHQILNIETIKIPKALSRPDGLKYLRNSVLDVLEEYQINKAGLRVTEVSSLKISIHRIEIEGVIQEAFASSFVERYYCGQISNISSRLGINRRDFKPMVQGQIIYDHVENWSDMSTLERESILTAIGAINA